MTRAALPLALALAMLLPSVLAGNADEERYTDFADATGWNTQKKMARADDGSLYYAYVVPASEGNGTEVVVVREAPDGALEELPRPRAARGDVARPSITLDGAGRLWVAWTERAEDDREVFAARLEAGRWADAQQLSGGLGYAGFPSLAADGLGRVHIAWYGFDGTFYQTFYREWRDGAWQPARQLSSGNLDANNPSVVVDEENGVHVAWYKSDGRRYRVWYAHRDPAGEWSLPEGISRGEGEAFNGALAIDRAGRVHAVWDERGEGGFRVVHAIRDEGWAPRVLAEGDAAGEYPAIAAHGEGVAIVWSAANGTLAWAGEPLLPAGTPGRVPSLRGWQAWPASERDERLDVLWTQPDEERSYEVEHAVIGEGRPPASAPIPLASALWAVVAAAIVVSLRRR